MAPGSDEKNHDSSESDYDLVETINNSGPDSGISTPPEGDVTDVTAISVENGASLPDAVDAALKKVVTQVSVVEIPSPNDTPSTVCLGNQKDECTSESEGPSGSGADTSASSQSGISTENQTKSEGTTESESLPVETAESATVSGSSQENESAVLVDENSQREESSHSPEHAAEEEDSVAKTDASQEDHAIEKDEASGQDDGGKETQNRLEGEANSDEQLKEGSQQEEDEHKEALQEDATEQEPQVEEAQEEEVQGEEAQEKVQEESQEEEAQKETQEAAQEEAQEKTQEEAQEETQEEAQEETKEEEQQPEPEPQYNPFSPEDPEDDDSDSEDSASAPKPHPSRPDMPLLPALGRKLLPKSADGANLPPPDLEWERLKTERGEKSKALDQLMSMVGLEEVKRKFLDVKTTIAAAKERKGKLRRQDLNLVLMGNAGIGKRSLSTLYRDLLTECGVWSESPHYKKQSGFEFQRECDVETLGSYLKDCGDGLEIFLFLDSLEGACWSVRALLLHVVEYHANRLKLVVVLAGTVEGMNKFLGSRPNGRWVFPRQLQIKDYEDEQLRLILLQLLRHNSFTAEGGEDGPYIRIAAKRVGRGRGPTGFANVYDLILAFGKMVDRQAARLKKEGVKIEDDKEVIPDTQTEEPEESKKADEGGTPNSSEDTLNTEENPAVEEKDAGKNQEVEDTPKTDEKQEEENQSVDDYEAPEVKETEPSDDKSNEDEKPADAEGHKETEGSLVDPQPDDAEKVAEEKVVEEKVVEGKLDDSCGQPDLNAKQQESQVGGEKSDVKETGTEDEKPTDTDGQKEAEGSLVDPRPDDTEKIVEEKAEEGKLDDSCGQHDLDGKQEESHDGEEKLDVKQAESEKSDKVQESGAETDEVDKTEGAGKTDEVDTPTDEIADPDTPKPDLSLLTREDLIGPEPEDIRSHSEAWQELDKMAGLEDVKKAIGELLTRAKANYRREILGKEPLQTSLNRVFLGPPGTGKTTVAKLYGQILADIGLLSTKEVVYKTPADFIGQYIGESEANTSKILDSTIGKVLIIDDAHMFYYGSRGASGGESDIFRLSCIDTLIAKIHNKPGEDRCVILLGYADMMEEMFQKVNPGLKRRFPLEEAFRFKSYDDETLNKILRLKMDKEEITASEHALEVAAEVLRRARDRPNFGNGGDVDNLLNQAKTRFRERTIAKKKAEEEMLKPTTPDTTTQGDDLPDINSLEQAEQTIFLLPADFDPEHDRGSHASKKCQALFQDLIGFDSIISTFQGYQRMAANLRRRGRDPRTIVPFTFLFKGPPGTGKTHTARIVGQIFYDMGFLSTNEVVECSASHLIGKYLGHTAPKVVDLFERALGKVLFIDEAYRLAGGSRGTSGGNSFEAEAVGELVDCMTKPRYLKKMIIVLAGYDKDMDALMQVNAGLRGRFATEIVFPPMSAARMWEHLLQVLKKEDVEVRDLVDPGLAEQENVLKLLHKLGMTTGWSNGRDIKTLAGVITGSVYKNAVLEDGEDEESMFRISTPELNGFLREMLRQRMGARSSLSKTRASG